MKHLTACLPSTRSDYRELQQHLWTKGLVATTCLNGVVRLSAGTAA